MSKPVIVVKPRNPISADEKQNIARSFEKCSFANLVVLDHDFELVAASGAVVDASDKVGLEEIKALIRDQQ